jgi:DNA uptake protein ComE-like DNA-binding protein
MPMPQRRPSYAQVPVNDRILVHPNRWLLLVALGFGFTTWAAFLYLGLRARRRSWLAWAAVYGALLVLAGVLLTGSAHGNSPASGTGTAAQLIAWLGGTAHAAAVRRDAAQRGRPSDSARLDAARQRIERREEGRRLAARDPRLAREVGVGRPDVAGSDDFGLIDLNHASQDALCQLPGVTPEIARRMVEIRQRLGSFKSAEDIGVSLDLSPDLVDDMKEYAVFL